VVVEVAQQTKYLGAGLHGCPPLSSLRRWVAGLPSLFGVTHQWSFTWSRRSIVNETHASCPRCAEGAAAVPRSPAPRLDRRAGRGRLGRWWQRGVVRVAAQALYEIDDAVLKPPVRRDQPGHLHQQGERCPAVALEDRLRLGAFPSARVRRTQEGPWPPAGRGNGTLIYWQQGSVGMISAFVGRLRVSLMTFGR